MNTNINRKRKYVKITSEILEREGAEGVSIRRIAKEAGCTSAVLYKHFKNLDHLIMLASVRFLEPYITEFRRVSKRADITSIQMDLYLWRYFINEAFKNAEYYKVIFFGDSKDYVDDYVYEYYNLFPELEKDFDGFEASIIFSNNLYEREYIRLRRAVHSGQITMDNARLLSQLTTAVFNGIFIQNTEALQLSGSREMLADHCYRLIYELFVKFVNPGTDLSIDGI